MTTEVLSGGLDSLREVIDSIPIPSSPSRLPRSGAVAGLSFLDAALNLHHVRRITERISVSNHAAPKLIREVDVSLRMLDAERRYPALNIHGGADTTEPRDQKTLWVPVDRMSVGNVVPIDVVNAAGERVPRLTQFETSRVIASGLYRLLRSTLNSHQDARDPDGDLHLFLYRNDECRLLVQHALVGLLTERTRPRHKDHRIRTAGTVPGHGAQVRELARRILDRYIPDTSPYAELLRFATNNYLVVVELDNGTDEHLLSFGSPLYIRQQSAGRQLLRRLRASRNGYHVRYVTDIQPTLRSYHLVVEAGAGLQVTRMYLSTDADDEATKSTARDLRHIAAAIDGAEFPLVHPRHKVLELEIQIALRRLSELLRRRRWEAGQPGIGAPVDPAPSCTALVHAIVAGEGTASERGPEVHSSTLLHPSVSPASLRAAADELEHAEISRDLSVEVGPPSGTAHAYWRRPAGTRPAPNRTRVEAHALINDTSGGGPQSVQLYAATVAAVAYLIGCLATGNVVPYFARAEQFNMSNNADAVVTVLLLFPGFLYSRLPLPNRHEVSGYLLILPRLVANSCIFFVAALAGAVATDAPGEVIRVLLIVATVLPLLGAVVLRPAKANGKADIDLPRMGGPRWLSGPEQVNVRAESFDIDMRSSEHAE